MRRCILFCLCVFIKCFSSISQDGKIVQDKVFYCPDCRDLKFFFSPDYLSVGLFFHLADHAYLWGKTFFNLKRIKKGDIVFVSEGEAEKFIQDIHPKIRNPYILLVCISGIQYDGSILKSVIEDPKLIAVFSSNVSGFQHPKLIPIPVGISPYLPSPSSFDKKFQECQDQLTMMRKQRIKKIYLSSLNITLRPDTVRKEWLDYLKEKDFCYTVETRIPYPEFLQDVASSHFVFCPPGDVYDGFRTWETLYLGSIPILLSSKLNSLFDGLPVLFIDDITEVNEEFLQQKLKEFSQKTFNYEKLTTQYWVDLISSYQQKARQNEL